MITISPEISIIVPVYNVEKYIHRCIDSILAQTFSDFELILVDDGSSDNSGSICDTYSAIDSRINVIHKENGGASSARNVGLDVALGKYIMFCDSDDYVAPNWVQQMYSTILVYPDAFINCNVWNVDSSANSVLRYSPPNDNDVFQMNSYYELYASSLDSSLWNKIYLGWVIRENKLHFDEQMRIGEDVAFNVEYYKMCNRIVFVSLPLYFYCSNDASLTHSYAPNHFELHRGVFSARLSIIEEEYLGRYLDNWLFRFVKMLDQVFDPRNPMSFLEKMRYNQKMMQTQEFVYCVTHAPGNSESPLFMKVIRKHNYYLFRLFQKLCNAKSHLHR